MKRLAFGVFLGVVLVAALSAQRPTGPSISGMADTIHVDHANGRTVFTGDVVIAVDGTEVTTKDVAVYDPATNTIELANGHYGYLPTPRHFDLGGYETWLGTNNLEREASVKITRAILGLLSEVN